jgi:hypothetical protein
MASFAAGRIADYFVDRPFFDFDSQEPLFSND